MKIHRSIFLFSTTLLLILFSISNIILSFFSLNTPMKSGEFEAMHNVAMGLYTMLILTFNITIVATGFFLLKFKRWAYILNLILLIFILLLLGLSDFKELSIQISPGFEMSITKEVIPIIIMCLLLLNFRSFWFKKKATQ